MVKGYALFKAAFEPFADSFLLIGGTACDLQLSGARAFRATHDIDILVVAESLSPPFADAFRTFRSDGEYQCYVSHDGARHYYRFLAPRESAYPPKLELLSRSILPEPAGHPFTPLPVDGAARSMSAIVLDPVYYRFAVKERELVDGMPCLSKLGLIALKACAYLNLSAEHAKDPASVRGDDIRKHRNDVFRMLAAVEPSDRIEPPPQIANDLQRFLSAFPPDHPEWTDIRQALGGPSLEPADQISYLRRVFRLPS